MLFRKMRRGLVGVVRSRDIFRIPVYACTVSIAVGVCMSMLEALST